MPDTLFEVPGYSIYRRDRVNKSGGGVMAYINDNMNVIRRTDLENQEVEAIWLEVCPFKSKRSLCNRSKTSASFLSGVPNTEKQMKARRRRRSAFIVSRCLEPLMKNEARVFELASQTSMRIFFEE